MLRHVTENKPINLYMVMSLMFFYCFLSDLNKDKAEVLLNENQFLKQLNRNEVIKTMEFLKYVGVPLEEIRNNVGIFKNNLKTIENRSMILQESGFEGIQLEAIENYDDIINETVDNLKAEGFIPKDLEVIKFLSKQIINKQTSMGLLFVDVNVSTDKIQNENIYLKNMRTGILKLLLMSKLELNSEEISDLLLKNPNIVDRSYDSIFKVIDILEFDYKFQIKQIIENVWLLLADPENLVRLEIEIKDILGLEFKKIAIQQPKILMSNVNDIKEKVDILVKECVPKDKLKENLSILTLDLELFKEKCKKIIELKL